MVMNVIRRHRQSSGSVPKLDVTALGSVAVLAAFAIGIQVGGAGKVSLEEESTIYCQEAHRPLQSIDDKQSRQPPEMRL
jgi:hypothetical protein